MIEHPVLEKLKETAECLSFCFTIAKDEFSKEELWDYFTEQFKGYMEENYESEIPDILFKMMLQEARLRARMEIEKEKR